MKTILDWYAELPPPYSGQATRNHINEHGFPRLDHSTRSVFKSAAKALDHGFSWVDTPEGHEYWHNVYRALGGDDF